MAESPFVFCWSLFISCVDAFRFSFICTRCLRACSAAGRMLVERFFGAALLLFYLMSHRQVMLYTLQPGWHWQPLASRDVNTYVNVRFLVLTLVTENIGKFLKIQKLSCKLTSVRKSNEIIGKNCIASSDRGLFMLWAIVSVKCKTFSAVVNV